MSPAQVSTRQTTHTDHLHPANYDEFFLYYVRQHLHPLNRALHVTGTAVGTSGAIASAIVRKPALIPAFIALGYAFAWFGHFVFEKNRPATFRNPFWSLASDYRMLGLLATGRLGPWLERARSVQHPKPENSRGKHMSEVITEPVTGLEEIAEPTNPLAALSQFYRALNARDLVLMEQNWDNSEDAVMDNPLGVIRRGWMETVRFTTGCFQRPGRIASSSTTTRFNNSVMYSLQSAANAED